MDTLLAASATEGKPNGSKHAVLTGPFSGLSGRYFITVRVQSGTTFWVMVLFLWPTGVIIIVTYGHEHDFFGYAVTALSIALNIMLYAAAMALLWFVVWIIRRVPTRIPD